jgi:DMSO/TMAO reductase YedYZ molybdopterin-dependent catalytic subunit
MSEKPLSRGFRGRPQPAETARRLPPGQYVERTFPVLSAGPTPTVDLERWDLVIEGAVDQPRRWTWNELQELPREEVVKDIHCVTKWSKLDTRWAGVSVDTLFAGLELRGRFVVAFSAGGYTTNLPIEDLTGGKAWIVDTYEGQPLPPEHGGPARLLVPHLYFWKSAKWIRGLRVSETDAQGFWEKHGYHDHGDPWKEQRYRGD